MPPVLSPHQKDNPHVVVLTPGPLNETYFEHAYLANYLGYTLVQGDDLDSMGRACLVEIAWTAYVLLILFSVE